MNTTPVDSARLESFELDFRFSLTFGGTEDVRRAILRCSLVAFKDESLCENIAMVANELLENAFKFGDPENDGTTTLRLRISRIYHCVEVETLNRVPSARHLQDLMETLDWIKSFPTSRDAYMARLRQLADGNDNEPRGHLGILRILYEGDGHLTAKVSDENVLLLRATLDTRGRA